MTRKKEFHNNVVKKEHPAQAVQAKSKPKTNWMANNGNWFYPVVFAVCFAVFAFVMLVVRNSDYLYAAQDRSIFVDNAEFFRERTAVPGGFMAWIGCYLTQYFYYPWLGGLMLVLVLLAGYFFTLKAFRFRGAWSALALIPVAALLASTINIGYWIYYLKMPGYWFRESLDFMFMALALWGFRKSANCKLLTLGNLPLLQIAYPIVWLAVGYPLFGWWAVVGGVVMVCMRHTNWIAMGVAAICVVAVPWMYYFCYSQFRLGDAWTYGFPLFQNDEVTSLPLILPFAVVVLVMIGLAFMVGGDKFTYRKWDIIAGVIILFVCGFIVTKSEFSDENYHKELRMFRAATEQRWGDVLMEAGSVTNGTTRQIVLLKNLALTNTGQFGEKFAYFDNGGIEPVTFDSLHVHLVQTCGPLLYMYYGKENFATRWSIENEVEFGLDITKAKTLTWAALVAGEKELARKYIEILKTTTFHKDWALKYEPILSNMALVDDKSKYPEFSFMKEIYDHCGSVLDGDEGLVELYLLNYFSHTQNKDSKLLNEVTLNFACIGKDIQLFWQRFFLYAQLHRGEEMPTLYQEAAYLYGNLEKEINISNMPFDQAVKDRYVGFQQMSQSLLKQGMEPKQVGEAMKPMYGNTFWWFYFFCRQVKSY